MLENKSNEDLIKEIYGLRDLIVKISDARDEWKNKSIDRRIKIKALSKRIKELTISRDNWKNKTKSIKKKLEKVIKI